MKRVSDGKHHLESFKLFPYVAWALVCIFAFFVYHITVKLQRATTVLEAHTALLEAQVKQRPEDIKDFTPPKTP